MKKTILFLFLMLTMFLCLNTVNAKASLSVGDYFDILTDSRDEATVAFNYSIKMGYSSSLITNPTKSNFQGYIDVFNNNGGGDIILFRAWQ